MLSRRRRLAYFGIGVICVWITVTFYFFVTRPQSSRSNENEDLPHSDNRARRLRKGIEKLEEAVSAQKEEYGRLFEQLRKQQQQHALSMTAALEGDSSPAPPLASVMDGSSRPQPTIAVLVIACNRPKAITNHLDQLLKQRPSKEQFPIIVSQDCLHEDTTRAIRKYGDQIIFIQQPDQRKIDAPKKHKKFVGYYKISRHYKWALNQTFFVYGFDAVVITEDDLDIAVDFYEYFAATLRLLELDRTLWCVTAWNDNGKDGVIEARPDLLHRSDFFAGLGWMMRKSQWEELEPIWPAGFWDDWMRDPARRKDRACIRPEISRTAMSEHGEIGVSQGLFYEHHLKLIKLNNQSVQFSKMNLTYLLKDNYDEAFVKRVYSSPSVTQDELTKGEFSNGTALPSHVRLTYTDRITFKDSAKTFKMMDDFKAGVPRTAYRGIVSFMFGKRRVYLAPWAEWNSYDPTW